MMATSGTSRTALAIGSGSLRMIVAVFALCLIGTWPAAPMGAPAAWAHPLDRVIDGMQESAREAGVDQQEVEGAIAERRAELKAEVARLESAVAAGESELEELQKRFDELLLREEEAKGTLATELEQMHLVEGTVRGMAKDLDSLLKESFVAGFHPELRQRVEPLLDAEHFPGFDDVQALSEVFFSTMRASGQVERISDTFVDPEGREATGEIVKLGEWSAYYRKGEEVGFLRVDPQSHRPVAVAGRPDWMQRRALRGFFAGEGKRIPLDLSGGTALEQLTQRGGARRWLQAGGMLIWPILLVGAAALVLILERLAVLTRIRTNGDAIMKRLTQLAGLGRWSECRDYCASRSGTPVCRVLEAGLKQTGTSREMLETALEDAMLKEIPRLERFLPTLSVLAAVAPLLGLLGTVTGMIDTFRVITLFGAGDPRLMSGGISEALITTQVGLAVAIPIMIVHHFLERRVDRILGDMEEKAADLMSLLLREGGAGPAQVHRVA